MPPRILITRPEPEAAQWVAALQARGIAAQALPLIDISAPSDAATLARLHGAQAAVGHGDYHAIMVVSGQATRQFFGPEVLQKLALLAATGQVPRIWAPGPGTARSVEALGVAPSQIDQPRADASQFDSEALWSQVRPQISPGFRVLIVRGSNEDQSSASTSQGNLQPEGAGREWLAQQLQQAGAQVDKVVAYQRTAPVFTPEQQALAAQAAHDGSIWLLSSSQAVAHLQTLRPAAWQQARALATHPRIAAAAQALGFGTVGQCRPALKEVAASIESVL